MALKKAEMENSKEIRSGQNRDLQSSALQIESYQLDNGLTIWLNEDSNQPKIVGAIVVKAGAKHCPNTGIAHYFEHMMFKGTDRIGTTDYEAEKPYLDLIAQKYDELAVTTEESQRTRLQQEINALSVQSAEYVIPNEFNRLISRYGGTELNAATSYDATFFFNTFSPQYVEQWAALNSERLINPVFRLFQNELETVYEEKNMYGDWIGGQVMDTLMARYFGNHPYAYPIIGSTQQLKNPRLSAMRQFFETYYVANNMAVILSGDFCSETVLPILQRNFSRIRNGNIPEWKQISLSPFSGREKLQVKFPVPFMKVMGMGFRGVAANHKDQVALNIAVNLLNNANGTGFLDRLMVEHKLLGALAINQSMHEAGILAIAIMPKFLIQSYDAAEKLIWKEINRVKEGDFSDEQFNSLKLEQKRKYTTDLEQINSRVMVLMNLYSQGKSWKNYLEEVRRIEMITREEVIQIARKYFTENYLCVTKTTGKYPKELLPKPHFDPVVPTHGEASSAYAHELEQLPTQKLTPRIIDFEKEIERYALTGAVTLYTVKNPVNDIFTWTIRYGVGVIAEPALEHLGNYLIFLGTDQLSYEQFRNRLQAIGSTLSYDATAENFSLQVTGFENHLEETLQIVGDFILHVKADETKKRQLIDDAKVIDKAFFKSSDNVAIALLERVKYGEQSHYLRKLTPSQLKKRRGAEWLSLFKKVQQAHTQIHYCGNQSSEQISTWIRKYLPLERARQTTHHSYKRPLLTYEQPCVYFFDMPDLSQSIVYAYVKGAAATDSGIRHLSRLFSLYFGGDMSSLMFQEIREFRSYAYRTRGGYLLPNPLDRGASGAFIAQLSTQLDKTIDALRILDSLIREMPAKPDRMEVLKKQLINQVNNDYPSFRKFSIAVAKAEQEGLHQDPAISFLEDLSSFGIEDIMRFYQQHIQGRPIVYIVVGNRKRIDMNQLATFGTIKNVKKKEIYKL